MENGFEKHKQFHLSVTLFNSYILYIFYILRCDVIALKLRLLI